MNNAKQVIEETATYSDAVILIVDFYMVETSDIIKAEDLPSDLKGHPNAMSALSCIIHTKNGSQVKQLFYSDQDGKTNFFEGKWESATFSDCHFQNPYLQKTENNC
jgi:hypothetical protein